MRDYGRKTSYIEKPSPKKYNLNSFIIVVMGLIVLSLLVILAVNFFGYHSTRLITTSYGRVRDEFNTKGILIRDEEVTLASKGGIVKLHLEEGRRVSIGNHIATIEDAGENVDLYNYRSGLLSYKVDGLESTLRMEEREKLDYSRFNSLKGKSNPIRDGDKVNIGRPIFKIVDNFKFYLAVLLPQEQLSKYEVGTGVEILFSEVEGQYFRAKVDKIIPDNPQNIMLIEIRRYIPELLNLRKTEVKVVRRQYHGIVIPNSALIENKDKIGVLVNGYTKNYFREVEVIGEVGEKAIIKGIGPGFDIFVN
ncbi:HlyD family efflux transporter periplasmic adaptor subunit [Halonatronum saccharophilum]|uniref:HlyD family efflux transporter periplasmic adaptor subunit n=1 Tax=Halonatronum saccharophilum TaxID=150060 RepID=UPI000489A0B4|nr:HlyD family efflux transporter periplasmic adaptor subunit [Halonatronum saccharophilum]